MSLIDRVIADFGPEDHEHYIVVQYCEARGIPIFHVPNETFTKSPMRRLRNKLLGLRAGVSDLFIPIAGVGMLIIEMKKRKVKGESTNYPTPAQRAWIDIFNQVPGCEAHVCYGADEAIKLLEELVPNVKPIQKTAMETVF